MTISDIKMLKEEIYKLSVFNEFSNDFLINISNLNIVPLSDFKLSLIKKNEDKDIITQLIEEVEDDIGTIMNIDCKRNFNIAIQFLENCVDNLEFIEFHLP